MKNIHSALLISGALIFASGCATNAQKSSDTRNGVDQRVSVDASYLANKKLISANGSKEGVDVKSIGAASVESAKMPSDNPVQRLAPIDWRAKVVDPGLLPNEMFSLKKSVGASANNMPLKGFIHYIFSDLLNQNYVLGERVMSDERLASDVISLSLANLVSPRELFVIAHELLAQRGINVKFGGGTFYLYQADSRDDGSDLVIGIGRKKDEVPNTNQTILQVVPLDFGVRIDVERTLIALVKAKITSDYEQSSLFITGTRKQVLRAIDLVNMLDKPAARGKFIGFVGLTYISPADFSAQIAVLLQNEGVQVGIGQPASRAVVMVPLEKRGAVVVFASNEMLLDRVRYWTSLVDVPSDGSNEQYFIYSPQNARAIDLGESVSALLGVTGGLASQVSGNSSSPNAPSPARQVGINNGALKMVVDERSNVLVFYTTGGEYRAIMPLLEKLDTMPKQVVLDITIAEVSMKDEFKFGVEWALQRGEVKLTTQGAFGEGLIGGLGLSVVGTEGPFDASFLKTNNLVNVLSNPTLMVRDGVTANISVGSDISVVGATTQDPISGERQTTSAEYRKTGVDVTVTPTVNARGIVVMKINQKISNSVPSSSGSSGNPDIFERLIETEVVARSGQTIMLGGLISENYSKGGLGIPGLAKIPLLGTFFKSDTNTSDRTELVMLITPRVLETVDGWDGFSQEFRSGLKFIDFK